MKDRLLATSVIAFLLVSLVTVVRLSFAETQPKDTVILKGNPMGGVKFEHKRHATDRGIKCETCHHPSKAEKALTSPQQACFDCHTKPATAPMKTSRQGAFHNPTATAGTCIDCHKAENLKGKKAPTKCMECHKKENA